MKKVFLTMGAIVMMTACTQTPKNPFLTEWDYLRYSAVRDDHACGLHPGSEGRNRRTKAGTGGDPEQSGRADIREHRSYHELSGMTLSKVSAVLFNLVETEGNDR